MSTERAARTLNGWVMLVVDIALYAAATALLIVSFTEGTTTASGSTEPVWWMLVTGCVVLAAAIVVCPGFFTLQPNEARVLILFGNYRGTRRESGFRWANPFYTNGTARCERRRDQGRRADRPAARRTNRRPSPRSCGRYKISLRARTLNGDKLKVNDKRGNPVDIAAVVVWRVEDTAKAVFDVDDYETYVATQSETAVRHLASAYPYDHGEDVAGATTRSRCAATWTRCPRRCEVELAERLAQAGVAVEQARLTHLAYAPEIAQAMLRRQQAEAVIAARRKIVTGAVSMVEMALQAFSENDVVELRRGAQGGHGQQPDGRALRREPGHTRWSTPARCTREVRSAGERRRRAADTERWPTASSSCSASTRTCGPTSRSGRRTNCAASTPRSSACCATP